MTNVEEINEMFFFIFKVGRRGIKKGLKTSPRALTCSFTAPIFHFCCTFRVMYANVAKRIKRPKRLGTLSVFTIGINQKHKKEIGT